MKRKFLAVLLSLLVMSAPAAFGADESNLPTIPELELLSGAATGSWYTLGAGIASKFNENFKGFPMTCVPGPGSIGNVGVISNGDSEIGMSYGPFLVAARNGQPPYEMKFENLRSIAVLQPTVIQPMTSLNIKTLGEVIRNKVKADLGVYPTGNASTFVIESIFKAYGLSAIDDLKSWGSTVYQADGGSLADAWSDRHINLHLPMLNVPASTVSEALLTRSDGKLLNLDDDVIQILVEKYGFQAYTIKAGSYESQKEDCKTVGLPIVMFCREDADENLIYTFTKTLYENKEFFLGVHSSFAEFDPAHMNEGVAIPLHPGAAKFYQEKGM